MVHFTCYTWQGEAAVAQQENKMAVSIDIDSCGRHYRGGQHDILGKNTRRRIGKVESMEGFNNAVQQTGTNSIWRHGMGTRTVNHATMYP